MRYTRVRPVLLLTLLGAAVQAAASLAADAETAVGRSLFLTHCARCHGVNGDGGEGPRLTQATLRHAPDDKALVNLILAGIPGTGMPSVWALDQDQAEQVANYVRSLGQMEEEAMPGDPAQGKVVYETRGGCPACHIVSGRGRGFGPELTDIGVRKGLRYLRESLLDPAAAQSQTQGFKDFLTVRAATDEERVEGYRVDEDSFWIHVRDLAGTVHALRKDELVEFEKIPTHSLMPNVTTALPAEDLDDLISYLMSLGEIRK